SGSRTGGGPLSAHTPHRGSGMRPEPRGGPIVSQASQSASESPAGLQPLKPGDYMSSAGIRTMTPRPRAAPIAPPIPPRPPGEGGGEPGKREVRGGPSRPLPPVAATPATPARPGGPVRPAAPGPVVRTQRPEKSINKADMLDLIRSGQLSALQSSGGAAPGGA